jgi:hypothetical protein
VTANSCQTLFRDGRCARHPGDPAPRPPRGRGTPRAPKRGRGRARCGSRLPRTAVSRIANPSTGRRSRCARHPRGLPIHDRPLGSAAARSGPATPVQNRPPASRWPAQYARWPPNRFPAASTQRGDLRRSSLCRRLPPGVRRHVAQSGTLTHVGESDPCRAGLDEVASRSMTRRRNSSYSRCRRTARPAGRTTTWFSVTTSPSWNCPRVRSISIPVVRRFHQWWPCCSPSRCPSPIIRSPPRRSWRTRAVTSQWPHAGLSAVHGFRAASSGEHVSAAQLARIAESISAIETIMCLGCQLPRSLRVAHSHDAVSNPRSAGGGRFARSRSSRRLA